MGRLNNGMTTSKVATEVPGDYQDIREFVCQLSRAGNCLPNSVVHFHPGVRGFWVGSCLPS